jgi:hypothetical protein
MHAPEHDPDYPEYTTGEALRYRRPVDESYDPHEAHGTHDGSDGRAARRPAPTTPLGRLLYGPRARPLLLAGALLILALAAGLVWYVDPTNRARRELAQANQRILDKQREVDDARRLLERRLAELRAARADADVYATVYRGVLEREGKAGQAPLDAAASPAGVSGAPSTAAGEVTLPPVAPQDPAARPRP